MTLIGQSPTPSSAQEVEVLFEEARRRRRRRWIVGVVAFFSLLSGAGVYAFNARTPGLVAVKNPQALPFHLLPGGPSLGAATAYPLKGPLGVALDRLGDIYLTDSNAVLRVDHATGQIAVVAGTSGVYTVLNSSSGDGGQAIKAKLSEPSDVAVAPNGDLYILDFLNDRVREVSATTGIITTVAGDGERGSSGDGGLAVRARLDLDYENFSSSIVIAPNGNLYIADGGNNEVRKVSAATGIITRVAGDRRRGNSGDGGPALQAELDLPSGVALDDHGDLFIASGNEIREVEASTGNMRTVVTTARPGSGNSPGGLAFRPPHNLDFTSVYGGQVLSLNVVTDRVEVIAGTGDRTIQRPGATAGNGGQAKRATFGLTMGVAVDAAGDLYVADFFNNSVRRINAATGVISSVVGQIPQSPVHCC